MGNIGSSEEGVEETPGRSSSTFEPTSGTTMAHQEMLTAATDEQVQRGRGVTTGAHLRGSNAEVSDLFGSFQKSRDESRVRQEDSGIGTESTIASSRLPYCFPDQRKEETRVKTSTPYHTVRNETANLGARPKTPQTSTARPSNTEKWTLVDPYLTPEKFLEELQKKSSVTIIPLSSRPEFNQSSEQSQELFPSTPQEDFRSSTATADQDWTSPVSRQADIDSPPCFSPKESKERKVSITFATDRSYSTPAASRTEFFTADSRFDSSKFGPFSEQNLSPETPEWCATQTETTLRRRFLLL